MTLVRIIKNWNWPDLLRQTPGGAGMWAGIRFTLEAVEECDALLVLNHVPIDLNIRCRPGAVWAMIQEPPVPEYRWLREGFELFRRVYTPDVSLTEPRYHHSHGALPWHVNHTYDFLTACTPPEKSRPLTTVVSNDTSRPGQRARLAFLEDIKDQVDFDLWGRGIRPIDDKWDALAPYRYCLAIENYSGPHYWTEKLADCFLSWTMPIYYGCTNIFDYFPREAMVVIDINKPDEAVEIIHETLANQRWLHNREAIAHARSLVLNRYQIFPFVSAEMLGCGFNVPHVQVNLSAIHPPRPIKKFGLKDFLRRTKNKAGSLFTALNRSGRERH